MNEIVPIQSADFWVKVVEMLQQNWAVIESRGAGGACVYFITDMSGVFDEISYSSMRARRYVATASDASQKTTICNRFSARRLRRFVGPLIPTVRSLRPAASGDHERCSRHSAKICQQTTTTVRQLKDLRCMKGKCG
jgi:hypothetical protein